MWQLLDRSSQFQQSRQLFIKMQNVSITKGRTPFKSRYILTIVPKELPPYFPWAPFVLKYSRVEIREIVIPKSKTQSDHEKDRSFELKLLREYLPMRIASNLRVSMCSQ